MLLEEAVTACARSAGGLVLVTGTAGIGKSRLVAGAVEAARRRRATALVGRAVPSEVPVAYRPLAEALLAVAGSALLEAVELRGFRAALGRMVPAWRVEAMTVPEESPVVVAEALLRVLRAVAGEGPVVLVLEDLQWADPETLLAVEYLADHAGGLPVLCLATLRDESPSAALDVATRLEARRAAQVVRLRPLEPPDVAAMAEACLGVDRAPDGVETLLAAAEGVPFLVEELLAAAAAGGALVQAGDGWSISGQLRALVPRSFGESVRRRLSEVRPDARRLLGAAALLGRQFDWRLAAQACGCAPGAARELLDEAVGLQLLAVSEEGFLFRHALTREAVLDQMSPVERSELAAVALAALSRARLAGDGWSHLAADLAEAAGEPDGASRLLLTAGRGSLVKGALATARAAFERAERLAVDPELRAAAQEDVAGVCAAAGDLPGTRAAVSRLLDTLDEIGAPPARRGQAHLTLARGGVGAADFALAGAELALARRFTDDAADEGRLAARVAAVSAQLAIGEGRLGEAEIIASGAVAAAAATGQPEVECEALEVASRCARTRDLDEAREIAEQALHVADAAGLALWRVRGMYQRGIVEMFQTGSTEPLERTRDEAQRLGAVGTVTSLDLEIAAGLEMQCRREEALATLARCIEMSERLGMRMVQATAHVFVAIVHAESGRRREMEAAISRSLALAGDDPEIVGAVWGDARAVASLAAEDHPRAHEELRRAVAAYGRGPAATPRPGAALHALVATLAGEDPDPAAFAGSTSVLYQAGGYLHYTHAVRLGREGRAKEAGAAAQRGEALLEMAPWYLHLVHRLCAEAAVAGSWGEPERWLTEAARYFDEDGSVRLASACRALLRGLGVRVSRPTRAARGLPAQLRDAGITRREAEVLELVSEGLANADIAMRLHLSIRTVEHHVGWLKRKLCADTRAQLIAFAATIDPGTR